MNKAISRPRTLAVDQLDLALEEALLRVSNARELSKEECVGVSGGLPIGVIAGMMPTGPWIIPTIGMLAPAPIDFSTVER